MEVSAGKFRLFARIDSRSFESEVDLVASQLFEESVAPENPDESPVSIHETGRHKRSTRRTAQRARGRVRAARPIWALPGQRRRFAGGRLWNFRRRLLPQDCKAAASALAELANKRIMLIQFRQINVGQSCGVGAFVSADRFIECQPDDVLGGCVIRFQLGGESTDVRGLLIFSEAAKGASIRFRSIHGSASLRWAQSCRTIECSGGIFR